MRIIKGDIRSLDYQSHEHGTPKKDPKGYLGGGKEGVKLRIMKTALGLRD